MFQRTAESPLREATRAPRRVPVEVNVITDDAQLASCDREWEMLLRATPEWSGFQSLAWITACRLGLPGDASLFVLRFRAGGQTVGIMPTELGRAGDLRFIGAPVTNYAGLLYQPGLLHDITAALGQFLNDDPRVHLIDWSGLRTRALATAALRGLDVPGWTRPRAVHLADC